jgi:hypothetical protein
MNTQTLPNWQDATPGLLASDGSGGMLLLDVQALPEVDEKSMSARARICTARLDRQGDVIEPSGVSWDDYRNAPTVKYEHGFTGVPWPIATSEDSEGRLHVKYDPAQDAIFARSFFTDRFEISEQIFALIAERFLRATSIHVLPDEGGCSQRADESYHVRKSSLLEWSWCSVGVNPDAYAKALVRDSKISETLHLQLESASRILNRGTLNGRPIVPSLARCLLAVQPPRNAVVRGFKSGVAMGTRSLSPTTVNNLSPAALAKAMSQLRHYDAKTSKLLVGRAKALEPDEEEAVEDFDAGDETYAGDEEELAKAIGDLGMYDVGNADPFAEEVADAGEASTMPQGAQFLEMFHGEIKKLFETASAAIAMVENPQVIGGAQPIIDELQSAVTALEGMRSSLYAALPPLDSAAADADLELAKSWLATPRGKFALDALAARLERLRSGKVTASQAKSLIASTVRDMRLLTAQAKSYAQQGGGTAKHAASMVPRARYEALALKTAKLVERLKNSPAPLPGA